MADLTCKQDRQDFFCRNFKSQRTCVSNSKALTLTAKDISSKNYGHMCRSANKYAKEKEEDREEKEKNTTTLAICHGTLLATTGGYLQNNILL